LSTLRPPSHERTPSWADSLDEKSFHFCSHAHFAVARGFDRRDHSDPNTAVGGNTFQAHTLGLNYYLKGEDLKFMLNYVDGHVPGSSTDGGRLLSRLQIIF
jgi:hypothetical protein